MGITGYHQVQQIKPIQQHFDSVRPKKSGNNDYGKRHVDFLIAKLPLYIYRPALDNGLAQMIAGLVEYAEAHQERYEDPIGNDGVIGRAWLNMLLSLRELMTGETGNLSAGDTHEFLLNLALHYGFSRAEVTGDGSNKDANEGT